MFWRPICGDWNRSTAARNCTKCASSLPQVRVATEAPDALITALRQATGNRYRILRRIGSGGAHGGRVRRQRHERQLGRPLAVKVVHSHLARDEEMRTRFRREAEASSRLVHPLIATPIDYGEVGEVVYLRSCRSARRRLPRTPTTCMRDRTVAPLRTALHREPGQLRARLRAPARRDPSRCETGQTSCSTMTATRDAHRLRHRDRATFMAVSTAGGRARWERRTTWLPSRRWEKCSTGQSRPPTRSRRHDLRVPRRLSAVRRRRRLFHRLQARVH